MSASRTSAVEVPELFERIRNREARIAVIGCGYVGLPLSLAFARAGYSVVGIDNDEARIARLRDGESYILDVPSDALRAEVKAGRFAPSTDYALLRDVDVIFVSVPTPSDRAKQPDLTYILAAAEGIAANLRPGHLVILESTTFPGTTDEVLRPILERSGLRAGIDFYLAFSPERIDPGNQRFTIENTPKVVGGEDPESTALAVCVLEQVITRGKVHAVSSSRAAELTKLLENTFRAVNIALVNELAMLCNRMGIDIWEVIDAAATKPYGFVPFYPGPGVGGHCIPIDPYYLSWKAREYDFNTKFIELAAQTNLEMPFYVVSRIQGLLNRSGRSLQGSRILVLGAAFKKDVDDARNSVAARVMEILRNDGAEIEYHDPFISEITISAALFGGQTEPIILRSVPLTSDRVRKANCVVVLVGHSAVDYGRVLDNANAVFDAVNATRGYKTGALLERL